MSGIDERSALDQGHSCSGLLSTAANLASIIGFLGVTVFQPTAIQDIVRGDNQVIASSHATDTGTTTKSDSGSEQDARAKQSPASSNPRTACTIQVVNETHDDRGYPDFLQEVENCLAKQGQ
jgi:hypothetical protein